MWARVSLIGIATRLSSSAWLSSWWGANAVKLVLKYGKSEYLVISVKAVRWGWYKNLASGMACWIISFQIPIALRTTKLIPLSSANVMLGWFARYMNRCKWTTRFSVPMKRDSMPAVRISWLEKMKLAWRLMRCSVIWSSAISGCLTRSELGNTVLRWVSKASGPGRVVSTVRVTKLCS